MKNSIYVCSTYYQVYVTLVKTIISKQKSDIVICSSIPDCQKLIKNLKKSNLFMSVIYYDEIKISELFNKENIERKIFRKNEMIDLFQKNSDIDFKNYKDIYVYNDWTTIGAYLIDMKIKYHLIEDGLDAFYYIKGNFKYRTTFLNPDFKYRIKKIIKKILHIGYDFFGQSKYVIDIEVNDKSKIFIKNKNVVEVPRKELFSKINEDDKLLIYNIFMNDNIDMTKKGKKILLLTQPLFVDKMVLSMKDQIDIYTQIINDYIKDYDVYIKAHPRDNFDYKKINNKVNIVSKNIPIEILNYNKNVNFDKAITITSSSLEQLNFVKDKIALGFEFLESRRNNENSSICTNKTK